MSNVWINGAVVPAGQAMVPALDRGVLWGQGLFETLRAYRGRVWAWADHYERMLAGGEVIDLPVPTQGELELAMLAALHANALDDAGVRMTITRGAGPPDPGSEPDGEPNVIVTAWPIADYTELYEKGVALVCLPGGARPLAGIKTTSYAVSVAGRITARRAGADDGLFVGESGRVLEGTGSNLFAIVGSSLVTPPLAEGVLPGVTRRHVIAVAARSGFEVVERPLHLPDLIEADEVLLTSSLREVYPVRSIDDDAVKMGDGVERLRLAYRTYVQEELNSA